MKVLGCGVGLVTFVFGLVVVLPVMLWCLFWLVVANGLIWVFKKGCRVAFRMLDWEVEVEWTEWVE